MDNFIVEHWKTIIIILFLVNVVGTMPTPNGKGLTGSIWYKWLFGTLHGFLGGIPRLLVVFVPQWARVFGLITQEKADEKTSENILNDINRNSN